MVQGQTLNHLAVPGLAIEADPGLVIWGVPFIPLFPNLPLMPRHWHLRECNLGNSAIRWLYVMPLSTILRETKFVSSESLATRESTSAVLHSNVLPIYQCAVPAIQFLGQMIEFWCYQLQTWKEHASWGLSLNQEEEGLFLYQASSLFLPNSNHLMKMKRKSTFLLYSSRKHWEYWGQ